MSISFGSSGNGLVDFGDGDSRIFGNNTTSNKNSVSWTARETNRYWYSVASSADGTKLVAVVLGGQIYTSTDSGVSWTARENNRNWYSVASSSDGTKLVAVVVGGQIYTSTDSGLSWTARETNRNWYSVASSSDGTKLAAVVYNGQIYTSTDSGLSWTARENSRNWLGVASSSDGTKLVAVESGGYIYTSTNSGVTWTARENGRNWYSVASSSDGTKLVAVVVNGQIYTVSPKTLTVSPSYNRITFTNNAASSQRNLGLYSISNWGNLTNIDNMFSNSFAGINYGTNSLCCVPSNWNGITSASGTFINCNGLNDITINSNTLTNLNDAFRSAIANNITINSTSLNNLTSSFSYTNMNSLSLDTPSLTNTNNMLNNSNIKTFSIIDSSSIASMDGMFDGCSQLDSDFTGFSLAGLISNNLNTFMRGVTLSRANYNKTLVYWNANKASYQFNDFTIHMGNSKADTTSGGVNGTAAKLALVVFGWTITDVDGTVT